MGVQMVIELDEASGAQAVLHAVDAYKKRLQASIGRTKRHLSEFEGRYHVGKAGSVAVFNGSLWHSSYINKDGQPRRTRGRKVPRS